MTRNNSNLPTLFNTPFNDFAIGFSDIFSDLDRMFSSHTVQKYPPYDIVKHDDSNYTVNLAVAGFGKKDIEIVHEKQKNQLVVTGSKKSTVNEEEKNYTHKGIAERNFTQTFILPDDMVVKTAELADGMLTVNLERIIPEHKKPEIIKIK